MWMILKMSKSETQIQREIINYLSTLPNSYIIRNVNTNVIGNPDLTVALNGKFIAIEIKKPHQKPRLNQLQRISQIIKANGIAFYTDSIEDLKSKLEYFNLI
jgi:hypothetical protein